MTMFWPGAVLEKGAEDTEGLKGDSVEFGADAKEKNEAAIDMATEEGREQPQIVQKGS